ncbi:MAG TPA: alpha-amylase family glycosyl hydrolase [Acidobacteriaceae bacterium]|jgi:alpha-glucosidase|nr:alpha-amylase family glycosyl hydrolase [Acidobacteriaceae bacterium]
MQDAAWWQWGIVYEVYPRSFQDSNNDGIGDLKGILERIDYLVDLGVSAVWIAPIYPSPMADFGYDVADYCGIDPIFGTMEDFDRLVATLHQRGLKVILDFVPNHTSDQHPWFLESRSSRNNPKRNWYLWRDQPNNWLSNFGGSGWEKDDTTGQYYYHSFLKQQPDLNWRNPAVQAAMFDVLRFWLRRGVDGFRVDVMWMMIKDDQFRDNPPNPGYGPGQPSNNRFLPVFNTNRPEVHDIVAQMRAVVDEFPERVLIGEIYLPVPELMTYYGVDLKGANLPFNFLLLQCAWTAEAVHQVIADYYGALPKGAWPNWVLGNHDNARIATRVGVAQARVAAMLLLTLPGTLTLYYGEEIGMSNVPIPPDMVQDPAEKNQPGLGQGRDPERTPMPWDDSPGAGFTGARPWLPIGQQVSVAEQHADPTSMLHLYRRLIELRRSHPLLVNGAVRNVTTDTHVLRYERAAGEQSILVLLNFGSTSVTVPVGNGTILVSTCLEREGETVRDAVALCGAEGLIMDLRP